jgi:hypothetical protein
VAGSESCVVRNVRLHVDSGYRRSKRAVGAHWDNHTIRFWAPEPQHEPRGCRICITGFGLGPSAMRESRPASDAVTNGRNAEGFRTPALAPLGRPWDGPLLGPSFHQVTPCQYCRSYLPSFSPHRFTHRSFVQLHPSNHPASPTGCAIGLISATRGQGTGVKLSDLRARNIACTRSRFAMTASLTTGNSSFTARR